MDNKYSPSVGKRIRTFRMMTISGLFAAVITLTTAYLLHIPIGATGGYMHIGDAFIYLAASMLSPTYAIAAAAVGGGLADLLSGMPIWILPTVIIKVFVALSFTNKKDKILCKRNIIALFGALFITIIGYYFAEVAIYGNWIVPIYSQTGNLIQCVASSILYIFIAIALDKVEFKNKMNLS